MIVPKVIKIEHIKTIQPTGSSGTGYSEPDIFEFWLDNGTSFTSMIDVWYRPDDVIVEECKKLCYEKLQISNPTEVFGWLIHYYNK